MTHTKLTYKIIVQTKFRTYERISRRHAKKFSNQDDKENINL